MELLELELEDCELLELEEDGMEGELLALWLLDWQASREAATTVSAISLLRGLTEKLFSSMDFIPCLPVPGFWRLRQNPNINRIWPTIVTFT